MLLLAWIRPSQISFNFSLLVLFRITSWLSSYSFSQPGEISVLKLKLILPLILVLIAGCTKTYLVKSGAAAPTAEQCSHCHISIYEEWRNSAHARAYVNPVFKQQTANYRISICLNCHAPVTIFAPEKITTRDYLRAEGVTCISCHLLQDKLHGPLNIPNPLPPHPVGENNPFFKQSKLCGQCHQKVYAQWEKWTPGQAPKKTCQECHMPSQRRRLIQDLPWRLVQPVHDTKTHSFTWHNEAVYKKAVQIDIRRVLASLSGTKGELSIEANELGHSLPTGDYGYHEVVIILTLEDEWGNTVADKVMSLFVETDTAIKPGEEKVIPFSLADPGAKGHLLRARVINTSFDRTKQIVLAEARYHVN